MSRSFPDRLFRSLLLITLWLCVATQAQASLFDSFGGSDDGPLDVEQAYIFSGAETAPGVYELRWVIEDDYYLYRDKVKLKSSDRVEVLETRFSESKPKDDPLFGQVEVYYHEALVTVRIRSSIGAPVDEQLSIEYQGCWEGGICYPPVTKSLPLNQVPTDAEAFAPLQAGLAPVPAAAVVAPAGGLSDGLSLTDQRQFTSALASGSWMLTIGLFLVAGLALSLTPCVFPMVPILAGVIAGQDNSSPRHAFGLSVVYVLSMAVTYTLAGVFAGLFGENLQAAFQNPWIISAFSLLFVVFAGAMFGFYQLEMPRGIQNTLNRFSRTQQGGNVAGVAVMGFLSALIVGPCVAAPLAGALIFIGQTGDPLLGGVALFALSIGMGLPLILIGTSAGKWLPRTGSWMNNVKTTFGVIMLLMAVWMLDRIVPSVVTMLLTSVILVVSAIYLRAVDSLPESAGNLQRLGKGVGILLLLYGGSLLIGAAAGNRSMLYPLQSFAGAGVQQQSAEPRFARVTSYRDLQPLLAAAKQQNRPVMLDFYADWCVSCVELESFTFADAGVRQQLERFQLVKVDVTANDDDAKALYQRFQIVGPPALVFYDERGALKEPDMIIGVPSVADFTEHLKKI